MKKFTHRLKRLLKKPAEKPEPKAELPEDIQEIANAVRHLTMTSDERICALVEAVRYVITRDISGAFVECGVWRGGSVLTIILTLQALNISNRDIYLYDTFEGMPQPTDKDTSQFAGAAKDIWETNVAEGRAPFGDAFSEEYFNFDDVKATILGSGYPPQHIHFVKGKVETTIPDIAPDKIALLRLDTDWYESTRHELVHLYNRIPSAGVLLIDDYGHWNGCRQAVDEFFARDDIAPVLLNRIDYTGRLAIKV